MSRKKDGRRNNGSESRGLTEASKLVTGPAALFAAMELRAEVEGIPSIEAWRRAARAWLTDGQQITPEDLPEG